MKKILSLLMIVTLFLVSCKKSDKQETDRMEVWRIEYMENEWGDKTNESIVTYISTGTYSDNSYTDEPLLFAYVLKKYNKDDLNDCLYGTEGEDIFRIMLQKDANGIWEDFSSHDCVVEYFAARNSANKQFHMRAHNSHDAFKTVDCIDNFLSLGGDAKYFVDNSLKNNMVVQMIIKVRFNEAAKDITTYKISALPEGYKDVLSSAGLKLQK